MQAGLESLNAAPQNEEERHEFFALKKQIVKTLVKMITIDGNRELHVELSLNLLDILADTSLGNQSGGEVSTCGQIRLDGIYTRIQLTLFHHRRCAFCG